jgi:large subunit ribosomal protein L25
MAEVGSLRSQERTGHGSRQARRLRKEGHVPGVLYGHGEATISVTVSADDLNKAIRHGARVVDLAHGSKTEKALIRDVQWDALGHDIMHVDFYRVSEHERITIDVRLELRGTAPGVTAGGVLDQPLHTLHVECPVLSVPDVIRVQINELQIDGAIHVKDLTVPTGVVVKNDPEAIVVQVRPPMVEPEAPAAAAAAPVAAEQAEPEVIGRQARAAEEGEEEAEKK